MSEGQDQSKNTTRCVVWGTSSERVPLRLLESLRRQHLEPVVRTEAHLAASAALAPDADRSRPSGVILVLVEPATLTRVADVVRAIERYAGRATCWLYQEEDGAPVVRRVEQDDIDAWDHPARPAPTRPNPHQPRTSGEAGAVGSPPALRLTEPIIEQGNDNAHAHEPDSGRERPEHQGPDEAQTGDDSALTDAELRMLLADGPSEGGAR